MPSQTPREQPPADSAPSKPSEIAGAAQPSPPDKSALRAQSVPYGIVGDHLGEVMRQVPVDEPPPLGENATLQVIGRRVPRLDAVQKVTGRARYTFDVRLPGMLYARRVVSSVAHARVLAVDTSAAERYPGVRAVHVLDRQLLTAQLRDASLEKPKYPVVRYLGQPIAGVAAESQRAADEAAALVRITYDTLPHVSAVDDAMRDGAPAVFPGPTEQPPTAGGGGATPGLPQRGNVRGPDTGSAFGLPRGDVDKGLAEADVVVVGEYRTQVQTHTPMETHGLVADWNDDGLTIYASTQFTTSVRDEAAEMFQLPKNRVRVISDFTGGGFGAKYRHRQLRHARDQPVAQGRCAGAADAGPPGGARLVGQPAGQPPAVEDRRQAGRLADRHLARELRHGRRRRRRRHRLCPCDALSLRQRARGPV